MDRLRKEGAALVYRCAKQHSEATGDKPGAKLDELTLTPLELIDRIAALAPPPRTHRHRYFGVLAPNSPLRASVTAMAQAVPAQIESVQVESATTSAGAPGVAPLWDECDAQVGDGVQFEPDWDLAAQPAPDYVIDQRVNW